MSDAESYVVTGGAGFIGSNVAAAIAQRRPKAKVIVVDNFRSSHAGNLTAAWLRRGLGPCPCEIVRESTASLDWPALLRDARPRAVVHLAAITDTTHADDIEMMRENVGGFESLLAEVARCEADRATFRLVYASSAAVYGIAAREPRPLADADAGHPRNAYGASKWLLESLHRRQAAARPGLPVVGLRYFNVFGPGEGAKGTSASMVRQLAMRLIDGKPPRLFADGEQVRDHVPVDDVVDATLRAAGLGAADPPRPGVYNVGSGVPTTFNDIIATLREALGIPDGILPTEYFEMPAAFRAFYQPYTLADLTSTRNGLGWTPRCPPRDAIARYAISLREARSLEGGAAA